jgi:hypothetical protein
LKGGHGEGEISDLLTIWLRLRSFEDIRDEKMTLGSSYHWDKVLEGMLRVVYKIEGPVEK